MPKSHPVIPADTARRLLMGAQGLVDDPARRATSTALYKQIERMGYVQIDTINIVDRAHNHILRTRFDTYQPKTLAKLLEKDRKLFEHWTHDASIIPVHWFPNWRPKFKRMRERVVTKNWWKKRLGNEPEKIIRRVHRRITREGPLMSKDFQAERAGGVDQWWNWNPEKGALEYLWWIGKLSVTKRINFHKVYDLIERVIPEQHFRPAPGKREHINWACRQALNRLGPATPMEIREFFNVIELSDIRGWCTQAAKKGEIIEATVTSANGGPATNVYAIPDWESRATKLPDAPSRIRLLSPFDPVVRTRKRTARLFNFDYTFEAFVPAAKRKYGYYVLPILEGDQFIGRCDPKLHRDKCNLEIKHLWWEPGIKPTKARMNKLKTALELFSKQLGADSFTFPK